MKKILLYLKEHIANESSNGFFILIFCGLVFGSILYRYQSGFDYNFWFYDFRLFYGFLFYGLPLLLICVLYASTRKDWKFMRQRDFWMNAAVIVFVLFGAHYLSFYNLIISQQPAELELWLRQILYHQHASIWYIVPALLYWYFLDKENKDSFYGLTYRNFDWRTYALMLVIVVPFIIWASFRTDFLETYPRYKPSLAEGYLGVPYLATVFVHEFFYLLQFLALELFFRGFIVLSLARYMGNGAVWVMVWLYVLIHFGKPWPETFSSAFGGYILGVLALKTRTVMGGVYIHGGVALLMEIFAYLQLYVFENRI